MATIQKRKSEATKLASEPVDDFELILTGYLSRDPSKRGDEYTIRRISVTPISPINEIGLFIEYVNTKGDSPPQNIVFVVSKGAAHDIGNMLSKA